MARRKKGNPVSGWLIVDKPAGLTSSAVVNKVKWACEAQKAGHAGTLDPDATGILAVALGEATKTVPYVTDAMKAYSFTVRWGASTTTDDTEGEVIDQSERRPSKERIQAALPDFTGQIMQIPPQVSAVKVDGKRAYDLARAGEDVDIAARPLLVESLTLTGIPDADHAQLEMVCGKGGYVRAIARDLGAQLGCFGHVAQLRRLWAGPFELSDAVSYATIEAEERTPALLSRLLPVSAGLHDVAQCVCTQEAAVRLSHGNPAEVITSEAEFGDDAWASLDGTPIAIGTYRAGRLHPSKVFNLN